MPREKAAPKTVNVPGHVSLYLNLEKPVPSVAFRERIEDVAHLLGDEQSILATPTNTLTIHFDEIFLGFCLNPQTNKLTYSLAAKTWPAEPNMHLLP